MTDTQIIKTIHEILTRLHDPKTGFNGYRHELRAQKLTDNEFMAASRNKISEMAAKHGMAERSADEQRFCLTGRDIIENRHYRSCGHAAKAFCYLNSQLPTDRRLDIKILLSTNIDNLMDGMRGHTVPCIQMQDGKYHAFDPQIATHPDDTRHNRRNKTKHQPGYDTSPKCI